MHVKKYRASFRYTMWVLAENLTVPGNANKIPSLLALILFKEKPKSIPKSAEASPADQNGIKPLKFA